MEKFVENIHLTSQRIRSIFQKIFCVFEHWHHRPAITCKHEATLKEVRVPRAKGRPRQKPKRVIADRAYDSDSLRERLKKRGIELIAPYRRNNKQRRYEGGRKLRRYKRRWIIERSNAWFGQFRRLLVRHEHLVATYRAFFYLACFWITRRRCL
jgi:transposase